MFCRFKSTKGKSGDGFILEEMTQVRDCCKCAVTILEYSQYRANQEYDDSGFPSNGTGHHDFYYEFKAPYPGKIIMLTMASKYFISECRRASLARERKKKAQG